MPKTPSPLTTTIATVVHNHHHYPLTPSWVGSPSPATAWIFPYHYLWRSASVNSHGEFSWWRITCRFPTREKFILFGWRIYKNSHGWQKGVRRMIKTFPIGITCISNTWKNEITWIWRTASVLLDESETLLDQTESPFPSVTIKLPSSPIVKTPFLYDLISLY